MGGGGGGVQQLFGINLFSTYLALRDFFKAFKITSAKILKTAFALPIKFLINEVAK